MSPRAAARAKLAELRAARSILLGAAVALALVGAALALFGRVAGFIVFAGLAFHVWRTRPEIAPSLEREAEG